jgi:predicted transcriptional regulator
MSIFLIKKFKRKILIKKMNTNNIAESVSRLKVVGQKIKELNLALKEYRKEKNELDEHIIEYLQQHDQPGLKQQDFVVIAENKKSRTRKKKSEKQEAAMEVLKRAGVTDPQKVWGDIVEATRGSQRQVSSLKTRII